MLNSKAQVIVSLNHTSPYEGDPNNLGFCNSGFQVSMSVELGLRFSIVGGFPDSLSCIPDFKSQNSGLQSKISRIFIDI